MDDVMTFDPWDPKSMDLLSREGDAFLASAAVAFGWQRWYAWHPVRLPGGRWTWLVYLDRRKVYGVVWNRWRYKVPA
jgi:hypothetical protein